VWGRHVTRMWGMRNAHADMAGKHQGKMTHGTPRCRYEDHTNCICQIWCVRIKGVG
jgi:hypothetical protein